MAAPDERPELRRVIPVGHEFVRADGSSMVATSVDLWSTQVVVHVVVLVDDAEAAVPDHEARVAGGRVLRPGGVQLRDDVGTVYTSLGGGGGGHPQMIFSHQPFDPPVPVAATTLWLRDPVSQTEVAVAL